MQYIDQQLLLDKTEGGRLIIEAWYPDSIASFENTARKFKVREEKTASASLRKMADGVWVVTDFGGDAKPRNGIRVVEHEEGCSYLEALHLIASKFNIISEEKRADIFKPDIRVRDAEQDEEDKKWKFEYKDFTMTEVTTILAPKVWEYIIYKAPKHLDAKPLDEAQRMELAFDEVVKVFHKYNFKSVAKYTVIKNRKATEISSTETYPIFLFDQTGWKKIYQPKSLDAGKRFMHYNGRPNDFLFGYTQAYKAFEQVKKVEELDEGIEDEDEPKGKKKERDKEKKKPKKLNNILMVSGGSDALNLACIGQCFKDAKKPESLMEQYWPVWMNSETAKLNKGQYKNLQVMAEKIYNLPDIDATGYREAHALAITYLDIHTIYLPSELRQRSDAFRSKPCKDIRDYFRFYTPSDFRELMRRARPYRFWDVEPRFNKAGEYTGIGYAVNNKHMINFLYRNGFARHVTEGEKEKYCYLHINGNIVTKVDPKKIRDYVNAFIEEREPEIDLINTFLRTTQLNESQLSNLPEIEIDFNDHDKHSQWLFFKNKTVKVTKDNIEYIRPSDAEKFVWDNEVIKHRVEPQQAYFTIKQLEDGQWDIDIHNQNCLVFRYLINTSRIYWRAELEDRLEGVQAEYRDRHALTYNLKKEEYSLMNGLPKDKHEYYRKVHQFNIAGPLLTDKERAEQKHHLVNKIYTIGYILHRYKDESKPWAVWGMDARQSEGDESHGGTGKSLLPSLLNSFGILNTVYREGRSPKVTENNFFYEGVTKHTDLIFVDDCYQYLKFDHFFSTLTGPIQVNPKNTAQYVISFSDAPKMWFTSNYAPHSVDGSKSRRLLYNLFSDYYHDNTAGEYREERKVSHDFGKNLGKDFTEDEWNYFLNFLMQCVKFYMSYNDKVNPPMYNVHRRNMKAIMGEAFELWADVYFSEDSGRRDLKVVRTWALEDFLKSTNQKGWTTYKFNKALQAWVNYNDFELNPKEYQNGQGRIIDKVPVPDKLEKVAMDMVFIKTKFPEDKKEEDSKSLPF